MVDQPVRCRRSHVIASLTNSLLPICSLQAWYRPDLFRRVLSYSGTFVNQQYPFDPRTPRGCWEYHGDDGIIARSPKRPIRVCLVNTERDIGWHLPESTWHNWPLANTRMATSLKQKGYECRHIFCRDANHVDYRAVRQTLPAALEWLFRGYGQRRGATATP